MNILFITDLIPIENNENCAKALIPIIKELSFEHNIHIIRPNFILNSLIREKAIKPNGEYNCNGLNIKNLNFFLPFILPIKDINIENYDKIIAHMPSGILFTEKLLSQAKKRPNITYAVHQSDIHVMTSIKYSIYFKNAMKKAYTNCDEIICRAPHLKEKLLKILPSCANKTKIKTSKIPQKMFISDEEMFNKIKTTHDIKFITAANLIKRKNIDLVIKSFSNFKEHSFTFEIIGDGKEFKKLKNLTKKLKLEDKIHFLGKLSNEDTLNKMRESNIFILPSINETLGIAYLEASAMGCLCVGTRNTGIDGIFTDNINCFLCDPTIKDISRIISKIFKLTTEDMKNLLENRKHANI